MFCKIDYINTCNVYIHIVSQENTLLNKQNQNIKSTCIHVIFVRKKCLFLWELFTDMGLEWSQDGIYASILVKKNCHGTRHIFD